MRNGRRDDEKGMDIGHLGNVAAAVVAAAVVAAVVVVVAAAAGCCCYVAYMLDMVCCGCCCCGCCCCGCCFCNWQLLLLLLQRDFEITPHRLTL